MAAEVLLRPRLVGNRFADGQIPLDVLGDLSALNRLLIEVAKWHLRQETVNRSAAVPRGFDTKFRLTLSGLEQGSAVPVISIESTENTLPGTPPPYYDLFERASHTIIQTVSLIADDPDPVLLLPREYLRYFGRIGRHLLPGEQIALEHPEIDQPVPYSADVYRRMVDLSRDEEFVQPVTLRGWVPEADQLRMKFEFHSHDTRRLISTIPTEYYETVLQAFGGYRDGIRLQIQASGRHDVKGRLVGFSEIREMEVRHPMDPSVQVDDLAMIRDGWLEGSGQAPPRRGLSWLADQFESRYPSDLTSPRFYPTPDGGVQIVWSLGSSEIDIDVNLGSHSGQWRMVDVQSQEVQHETLDLDREDHWRWFSDQIRARCVPSTEDQHGLAAREISANELPDLIYELQRIVDDYEQRHAWTSEEMVQLVDDNTIVPSIEVIKWYHTYAELRFLVETTHMIGTPGTTISAYTTAG